MPTDQDGRIGATVASSDLSLSLSQSVVEEILAEHTAGQSTHG